MRCEEREDDHRYILRHFLFFVKPLLFVTLEMGNGCGTQRNVKVHDAPSADVNRPAGAPAPRLAAFLSISHTLNIREWRTYLIEGLTPLQAALLDHNDVIVHKMVEAGAHQGFKLPANEICAAQLKNEIDRLGLASVILYDKSDPQSELKIVHPIHNAAKTGDEVALLELLIKNVDPWARDDFNNIPLYYCCLYGHLKCCAWLITAMGGLNMLPPLELDRCTTNALSESIKQLLKGRKAPGGMRYVHLFYASNLNANICVKIFCEQLKIRKMTRMPQPRWAATAMPDSGPSSELIRTEITESPRSYSMDRDMWLHVSRTD